MKIMKDPETLSPTSRKSSHNSVHQISREIHCDSMCRHRGLLRFDQARRPISWLIRVLKRPLMVGRCTPPKVGAWVRTTCWLTVEHRDCGCQGFMEMVPPLLPIFRMLISRLPVLRDQPLPRMPGFRKLRCRYPADPEGGSGNGSGLFAANSTGPAPSGNGYYEDGWVEVVFLDSANNTLADYKSIILNPAYVANLANSGATVTNITATTTNIYLAWIDCPVTNQYDPTALALNINGDPDPNGYSNTNGAPWTIITSTLGSGQYMVAPPGTKNLQFRLALCQTSYSSGAPHWDDCVLNQVGGPSPSVIGSVSPDGSKFFYRGTNNFTFTVTSASTGGAGLPNNPTNGIQVVMNGVNQSGNLHFSGTPTAWNVTLPGLVSNAVYNASISVSNDAGLITTASYSFDTFDGSDFVVPSETYDFTNGMFIQNWVPTAAPAANSYYGLGGVWGVDMNTYGAVGALPGGAVQLVRADGCVAFQQVNGPQLPIYLRKITPMCIILP